MNTRQVVFSVLCLCMASSAFAADPLYEQRPYDTIKLDENNGNAVLKVQPLDLPLRQMPPPQNRNGEIEIELVERPGERFKVAWFNITDIKFFEDLVLAEAVQVVQQGRFDAAYDYFAFLESRYPKTAGLKEAYENYLWVHSGSEFKAGRNDQALALMIELARRNLKRQGLSAAYARVCGQLIETNLAAGNYKAVRGYLKGLSDRFPELRATAVAPIEAQLQTKAASLVTQAQADLAAGKSGAAHRAAREALEVWPAVAGGLALAQSIHAKYPVVSVGVVSPLAEAVPGVSDDWASLRSGRLVQRTLVERSPAGAEGGTYRSPFGELPKGSDPTTLTIQLRPGILWPGTKREMTGIELARCLSARADRGQALFDPLWADLFESVDVRGLHEAQIRFQKPQLRPEALLAMPLWTDVVAADGKPTAIVVGPYRVAETTPHAVTFVRQSGYFAATATQPAEVVERTYADSAGALRALRRGEVSVIDRLAPWEIRRLAGSKDYSVQPYAQPTVHLLIPNPNRPLTASRTLRRAMLYALDRESILSRGLLDGQAVAGCEVLTGPFPKPLGSTDSHGYGYNIQVAARPYDPATAAVLARLAFDEIGAAAGESPALVLAHPAEPAARVACQSIARQLALLGLALRLREVPPAEPLGEHDLLYVELAMREPVVDVWRLFGPHGITGGSSPAMQQSLRELAAATDPRAAAAQLQAIHRLVAAELSVIPLWQIVDHFAWHKSVQGPVPRANSLYQDIENWRVGLRLSTE